MYIYIYIFNNLLSTSIHGDKEKQKKTPEITNLESLPGEKKKKIIGRKKKKRPTSSHQLKKKSRDMQSVGQKKKKLTAKHCNATITKSAQC